MRRWIFSLIGICLAGALGFSGWHFRADISSWWFSKITPMASGAKARPVPDPDTYATLIQEMERWRHDLAGRYELAKTRIEREAVEHDAQVVLEKMLPSMMRCWLGTRWDFHGTAEGPGKGKIACGYFVSTVLKDAGFRVDRYRLAQQPSQYIMETFIPHDDCKLAVGMPYDQFADGLEKVPPGIYFVGLDTHVGFLVIGGDGFHMIHSSGSSPWCVVEEGRDTAEALRRSNWRMIGNFTGGEGVVKSWLKGGRIEVRTSAARG